MKTISAILAYFILIFGTGRALSQTRNTKDFDKGWKFHLGDTSGAEAIRFDDAGWRNLVLPHDWSIEQKFDSSSPATNSGGALNGGIGWYRKTFEVPLASKGKKIFIDFDGVYMNSEVWVNGHYLGRRPYGYSSFRYQIDPYLTYGGEKNVMTVKVSNAPQPNSRWYSGSGIYRNVWLVTTEDIHVGHWGTFITTPRISAQAADIALGTQVCNQSGTTVALTVTSLIYDASGKLVGQAENTPATVPADSNWLVKQKIVIQQPVLWSVAKPVLYKAVTRVEKAGKLLDEYQTVFGIRYFEFDVERGFSLNGEHLKINGVCDHHDLGCLGTAVNRRALQRQLEILKNMGCNAIRTSHNPPAPELLELCDEMGFIVLDEAFDMWKMQKSKYDYHLYWDEWHKRDLQDMVLRDRNHPSVIIWSIGNEINEGGLTGDTTENNPGFIIAKELREIVRSLDTTRPITSALNNPYPSNPIYRANALDLIGYNYDNSHLSKFHERFPGKKFLGTETVSALETRGHYDIYLPADSIRRWPKRWDAPFTEGNPDLTVSAYDQVSAPWGATHEETWKMFKKYDFLSGQFIWTGFDYIGEPTPYPWPARSSYFGIIDLAGFPKDIYYMYQSEWTHQKVLHLFPHWNWKQGDTIDLWAYYNQADQVELFLNGRSLGTRRKQGDDLHVAWRVPFEPGTLKAVSTKEGKQVMTEEIKTAGKPAGIVLQTDRSSMSAGGKDLCYVTVQVVDADGNPVPDASNLIQFHLTGDVSIEGVDNGSQISMESFKASARKAFNGRCLAVIRSGEQAGIIKMTATSPGLQTAGVQIQVK